DQSGLYLIDAKKSDKYMGYCNGGPSIPNNVGTVQIFTETIAAFVRAKNKGVPKANWLIYEVKLQQIIAHELLHGNNVCHHGEGDEGNPSTYDKPNGLRSGNVNCIMRYDNIGYTILSIPETPGAILCDSRAGTGYNEKGKHIKDALLNRGDCIHQLRVSAKGGIPKICGNK
ncbi:MAG: hypothetical protein WAR80_06985, partial [Ferruginibacter sp.]